jgi:hypothetical protein
VPPSSTCCTSGTAAAGFLRPAAPRLGAAGSQSARPSWIWGAGQGGREGEALGVSRARLPGLVQRPATGCAALCCACTRPVPRSGEAPASQHALLHTVHSAPSCIHPAAPGSAARQAAGVRVPTFSSILSAQLNQVLRWLTEYPACASALMASTCPALAATCSALCPSQLCSCCSREPLGRWPSRKRSTSAAPGAPEAAATSSGVPQSMLKTWAEWGQGQVGSGQQGPRAPAASVIAQRRGFTAGPRLG